MDIDEDYITSIFFPDSRIFSFKLFKTVDDINIVEQESHKHRKTLLMSKKLWNDFIEISTDIAS